MNERELDAVIAVKLFGWEWWQSIAYGKPVKMLYAPDIAAKFRECPGDLAVAEPDTERCERWDLMLPHYSTDNAATHLLGDMLHDRGLWRSYIEALIGMTGSGLTVFSSAIEVDDHWTGDGWEELYKLMQATPEQRARAALKALEAQP